MKIAVASSGLGHISRGVETWARDTADALHVRDVAVTLFSGAALHDAGPAKRIALACLHRHSSLSRLLVRLMPDCTWRWGLKTGYGIEQLTFWRHLCPHLIKERYDVLHVQDPMVALWCLRARRAGRVKTREILAHGTEEPAEFLRQFDFVQHLLPWHLEQTLAALGLTDCPPGWTVMPNFVDTQRFRPVRSPEEKVRVRQSLGLPIDAFIIGCAAAVKRSHKRLDYLIDEFAGFRDRLQLTEGSRGSVHLAIAGAREDETAAIIAHAQTKAPSDCTFFLDLPLARMPDFYRALDVFVLPSLLEMMGIVLVEAMACGIPVITHTHPIFEYVTGPGGVRIDLTCHASLANKLQELSGTHALLALAPAARARAADLFSQRVVVGEYIKFYNTIIGSPEISERKKGSALPGSGL